MPAVWRSTDSMGLRLTLHEDGRVLWDLPLSPTDWEPERVRSEVDTLEDEDYDLLSNICDFYSSKKRLQMVSHMLAKCGNNASFTDLLRVAVNPKYVSELVNTSSNSGLVVKDEHGYRVSPSGVGSFILISLATRKLLRTLDSTREYNKSFEEV